MAEAEEVLTDVARHATVFTRDLWHRYRDSKRIDRPPVLADIAERLSLLARSAFGQHFNLRVAQSPAPPNVFDTLLKRWRGPVRRLAIPATDGSTLWLPAELGIDDHDTVLATYRTMLLQQAMRARRGSAADIDPDSPGLIQDLYLLLEASAADTSLVAMLPGLAGGINALRQQALSARPPLDNFPRHQQSLEQYVRALLQTRIGATTAGYCATPADSFATARILANELDISPSTSKPVRLWRDRWTGEFLSPNAEKPTTKLPSADSESDPETPVQSGRLSRRPQVREAGDEDEQDEPNGAWMIQADEPHEKAEDPMGLQRPTDREEEANADHLGDMLSELPEARLVATPERPKDVLLSDDPPESRSFADLHVDARHLARYTYPEWNFRTESYRDPGAAVVELPPQDGPQAWVDATLRQHKAMLEVIRRRFAMLRAQRVVLRRQLDGEDIDLDACIDGMADLRAGTRLPEELYTRCRPAQRDIAIMLLIDISGSTDGWVSASKRIIDVEKEALLLVCIALREMQDPFAVQAFSGEGPERVTVHTIMKFDETFSNDVALRIAALEPERFTRAGAAMRHATGTLMQQAASHRLLLLLSDGKPNDVDQYEGRYGVEDMRQAVIEARLQGVQPFCLTIDRQASDYLSRIFGAHQYAMLPKSELLPAVLLDWMRRLIASRQG